MVNCIRLQVPEDACRLVFGPGDVDHSHVLDYRTSLGDELILVLNSEARVIAIELLGQKPCQTTTEESRG